MFKKLFSMVMVLCLCSCTGFMDPSVKELSVSSRRIGKIKQRPLGTKDLIAFVRVRNSSGTDVDVRDDVLKAVTAQGYTLTHNLDEASFVLIADLRYVGEKKHQSYGATIFGTIVGGLAGALLGNNLGDGSGTNTAIGAGVGAAAGAAAGKAMDNRNRVISYDFVIDLSIGERIEGGVVTNRKTNSSSSNASSSKYSNEDEYKESGRTTVSQSESTEFRQKQDFAYQEERFIVSAKKLNLNLVEASTAIKSIMVRGIASTLP
jgi:outer membrane lipoprotein SlyB